MNNYQKAIEILLAQLVMNCNIAEFWCLLGDAYMKLGRFDYAKQFYQNAIIMGEFKYDNMWLVDLDKYDIYPKSRIAICEMKSGIDLVSFNNEINKPDFDEKMYNNTIFFKYIFHHPYLKYHPEGENIKNKYKDADKLIINTQMKDNTSFKLDAKSTARWFCKKK